MTETPIIDYNAPPEPKAEWSFFQIVGTVAFVGWMGWSQWATWTAPDPTAELELITRASIAQNASILEIQLMLAGASMDEGQAQDAFRTSLNDLLKTRNDILSNLNATTSAKNEAVEQFVDKAKVMLSADPRFMNGYKYLEAIQLTN